MALWICTGCTCRYSVGAPRCPQCGSTEHVEEGQDMPKITVHGGPSVAGASIVGGSWSNEGDPDVWPEPAEEGGEEPSAGSSSEASPEKPPTDTEMSKPPSPSPAPTTASRSKKARTGSRSARSTAGDPTADTSAADE
jgi:hypothetical protein